MGIVLAPSYLRPTAVSIWSDVAANGGSRVKAIRDLDVTGLEWQDTVPGAGASSRGYAQLGLAADSTALPSASILNVLRIDEPRADGTIRTFEYRITEFSDTVNGPTVTIRCAPIIEDFGRQQMRSVSGGVPTKRVTFTLMSPADILSLVVLPAIVSDYGFTSLTIGTVTPIGLYSFDQRNVTHLGLISWLEQQTASESWLERVSESAWTLNLGTRGLGETSPMIHVDRNVVALDRDGLVDDNFANRVEPIGETASGETDPTGLEEALWDAAATSGTGGRTLRLADPDGSAGPIAVDGQLDGAEALTACEPLFAAPLGPSASFAVFDTTRRYLWWMDGTDLHGRDVESDTSVLFNLGVGFNIIGMAYDSSVDRLIVCDTTFGVTIIDPAGPTITHTTALPSPALSMSVLPALSRAYVSTNGSGTQIVNTSTGALTAWASGPGGSVILKYVYHTASTRIVTYTPGGTLFSVWASPAGAQVGSAITIPQAFAIAEDPSQTTLGVVATAALKWGTITVSGTPSFSGFTTMPAATGLNGAAISLSPDAVLSAGGRYYVVGNTGRYLIGWTGSAYTGSVGDLGSAAAGTYALERGPTTSETSNLWVVDNVTGIRRLALTVDCSAFEHWTASASSAADQTVVMPASGSGGPVRIATATGFKARVQWRANSGLDYLTRLTDPASIATYGPIDAAPDVSTILGKTNYWRGGAFDANTWRSDDTGRWFSNTYTQGGPYATRVRLADAAPVNGLAATFGATYTAPATTCVLAGLGAFRVLSPGDALSVNSASLFVAGQVMIVRQRTVADASGNATVPVSAMGVNKSAGDAVWLWQPDLGTIPGVRSDCLVLYGTTTPFGFLVPVPTLPGDSIAWVTAHVKIACYAGTPNTVKLTVRDPFATADHTAVAPNQAGDSSAIATGQVLDRWLSQKVDLANLPGHGFVRFTLALGTGLVAYMVSLSVMLAADSLADTTNQTGVTDLFSAEGPRGIWRAGQIRLAEGNSPTLNYRCDALEDDAEFMVGATANVNDPSRSIFRAMPRIVSVTRYGVGPKMPIRQPQIELATTPTSFLRAMVDLQALVRANTQNLSAA